MRRVANPFIKELQQFTIAALEDKIGPVSDTLVTEGKGPLVVEVDGHQLALTLAPMAYATVERVEALKRRGPTDDREDLVVLVVADRINAPARKLMESQGWGHLESSTGKLHLHAPGIRIDTTVAALERGPTGERTGVIGQSGRVLVYEILRRHYDQSSDPIRTSTSKAEFDLARSSASDAFRALKAADLINRDGAPVLPDLFWELAKVWQPTDRRWLATMPDPDDWHTKEDPNIAAWHLCGTQAAVVYGAPAVGGQDGPVDLYVPGATQLSVAVRRYAVADPISAVASIAVPPVPQVTRPGRDHAERFHLGWPVVHPIAAALDLAALDDARSHQILDEWHPDGRAVWHEQ